MIFYKMHGLGNDFMVIDAVRQKVSLDAKQIQQWARRDTGVGFDQCLLVEPSTQEGVDFQYRIFNADGGEVAQCGNGARCLGRFIWKTGLSQKKTLTVATLTTKMDIQKEGEDLVSVFLEPPNFEPSAIPMDALQSDCYILETKDMPILSVHALSVGNPHAVMLVDDCNTLDITRLGPAISLHHVFPEQCNAGFMQILAQNRIQLRVYERGVGETQACGSGAVAAAVVGRKFYAMDAHIQIELSGGHLQVCWEGEQQPIQLIGPAEFVYEGELLS